LHIGVGEVGGAEEGGSFGRRLGQWHVFEFSGSEKTKKPHSRLCGLVYSSEMRSQKHSGMPTIMHTFS
jgi:hypothetical protein